MMFEIFYILIILVHFICNLHYLFLYFSIILDSTDKISSIEKTGSKLDNDDDILSGFFSEVQEKTAAAVDQKIIKDETFSHEKYSTQDLGDRKLQYDRIMEKNYEWRNLNPYFVLQLDIDATEEDIKQRYDIDSTFIVISL